MGPPSTPPQGTAAADARMGVKRSLSGRPEMTERDTPAQRDSNATPAATVGVGRSLSASLDIVRPGNGLMTAVGVLVGSAMESGWAAFASPPAYVAAVAAFFAASFGNVLNDLGDVEIDRSAHPLRPLPAGDLSLSAARILASALALLALLFGALVSTAAAAFVAVTLALMFLYERILKARGLAGNLVVAVLTGAPFVFGAIATRDSVSPGVWVLALLAALSNVGRELLKDIEDMRSDIGRATFPQRHGATVARVVAACALLAGILLSPFPWADGAVGVAYLPLVALADIGFIAAALVHDAGQAQRVAKYAMIVALLAFLVGRLSPWGGASHA
ncbi:MAG: UbiA family prenyltransferase [Thermoplasmatota archaeon]